MAAFDYTDTQADAAELIAEFGQAGQLMPPATRADPYDPDSVATTPDPIGCTLVVIAYTLREREASLIAEGDRKVLIAAQGLQAEPTAAFGLAIGADTFQIVRVMPVSPAGVPVLYEIQAR
jgi:hypothetical protein